MDNASRRILYEGDRYRWVIPFESIRYCEIEVAQLPAVFHFVIVTFETADDAKELPLSPNAGLAGANRYERAARLHEMLCQAVWPDHNPVVPAETALSEYE